MESPKDKLPDDGRVVYQRIGPGGEVAGRPTPVSEAVNLAGWRQLAPTLWPLLAGFVFLLLLVFGLGILSEGELNKVKSGVADQQGTLTARTALFSRAQSAAERLNNEAKSRSEKKGRNELQPPLAVPLNNARDDLLTELTTMDQSANALPPVWNKLRTDLRAFTETVKDTDQYDANGFVQFRGIREDFDRVQDDLNRQYVEVGAAGDLLRANAIRRVRILWVISLFLGVLVVTATVAEVQRRFSQMNRSVETARRERRFSSQILEGMVSAVAAIDARGRIRSANNAFMELFPSAKIGVSVHSEVPAAEALKALEAAIAQPVREATYFGKFTMVVASRSDAERTFNVYSSPLEIDAEYGRIITLVDVTDAVEAEAVARQTEALAAVGQASAQLAHEIKNPLGSVRLGVSILRDMTDRPDAINTIDLVERGIEHLNKLVVDVTQFSRQRQLNLAPVKIDDVLDVSLMLVEDRVQDNNIQVVRDFNVPLAGNWDEDQLNQVFVNLLANGIDASEPGSTINVTARAIAESPLAARLYPDRRNAANREYVRIVIEDHGSGLDAKTRAKIFEPFYTTKKRGTGLGLAVVKQIVEAHEGVIAVESVLGKGTKFIVDLPLSAPRTIEIEPVAQPDEDQAEPIEAKA
jgi:signal transduction histidine kinase